MVHIFVALVALLVYPSSHAMAPDRGSREEEMNFQVCIIMLLRPRPLWQEAFQAFLLVGSFGILQMNTLKESIRVPAPTDSALGRIQKSNNSTDLGAQLNFIEGANSLLSHASKKVTAGWFLGLSNSAGMGDLKVIPTLAAVEQMDAVVVAIWRGSC